MAATQQNDSVFMHMVFFWIKDEAPSDIGQRMIDDCWNLLASMPMVIDLQAGAPAGTPREVVDNSYHVGLIVKLQDKAAHDDYQVHENHQKFLNTYKDYWEKVVIYDVVQ